MTTSKYDINQIFKQPSVYRIAIIVSYYIPILIVQSIGFSIYLSFHLHDSIMIEMPLLNPINHQKSNGKSQSQNHRLYPLQNLVKSLDSIAHFDIIHVKKTKISASIY